jgi:hypothetical protein
VTLTPSQVASRLMRRGLRFEFPADSVKREATLIDVTAGRTSRRIPRWINDGEDVPLTRRLLLLTC